MSLGQCSEKIQIIIESFTEKYYRTPSADLPSIAEFKFKLINFRLFNQGGRECIKQALFFLCAVVMAIFCVVSAGSGQADEQLCIPMGSIELAAP